jgi:hypothetical protein
MTSSPSFSYGESVATSLLAGCDKAGSRRVRRDRVCGSSSKGTPLTFPRLAHSQFGCF